MPKVNLTKEELAMIAYWRESCHHYNGFCPLHCLGNDGPAVAFCKVLTKKIHETIKEAE